MRLLFGYLLISVCCGFGTPFSFSIMGYDILTNHNNLTSVRKSTTSSPSTGFNLSIFGLAGIDRDTFNNDLDFEWLDLRHNHLSNLPESVFTPLKNLRILLLSYNKLIHINFASNLVNTLTKLYVGNNRISSIPSGAFSQLNKLMYLDLSYNKIDKLEDGALDGLTSVESIELNDNQIKDIAVGSLDGASTLQFLYLGRNQIEILKKGTFNMVPKRVLSLTRNKITHIERESFNLPSLHYLYLGHNSLTHINPANFTGLQTLEWLALYPNNITNPKDELKAQLRELMQSNTVIEM